MSVKALILLLPLCFFALSVQAKESDLWMDHRVSYQLLSIGEKTYVGFESGHLSSPSPTEEHVQLYLEGKLLQGLGELPEREAFSRIIYFAEAEAYSQGIPQHQFRATFINGSHPLIEGRISNIDKILSAFEGTDIKWRKHEDYSENANNEVRPEMEKILEDQQQQVLEFIDKIKMALKEKSSLQPFLDRFDKNKNLDGFENAPEGVYEKGEDGGIDLNKMTAAENSWFTQNSNIYFSLKALVESLVKLESEPFENILKKKDIAKVAAEAVHKKLDEVLGEKTEFNADNDEASREMLADSFSEILNFFRYDPGDDRVFWTKYNQHILLPLYSQGMNQALDYLKSLDVYDEKIFSHKSLEIKWIFILQSYVEAEAEADEQTQKLYQRIAGFKSLHPLLRLTAYKLLENAVGEDKAKELTEMNDEKLRRLYRFSKKDVVVSPYRGSVVMAPHIDYRYRLKLPVNRFMQLVSEIGERLGQEPWELPFRLSDKDESLKEEDSVAEQALKRMRQNPGSLSGSVDITVQTRRNQGSNLPVVYNEKRIPPGYYEHFKKKGQEFHSMREFTVIIWKNGKIDILQKGKIIFQLENADAKLKMLPDIVIDEKGFEVTNESTKMTTYYLVKDGTVKKLAEKRSQKHFVRDLHEKLKKRSCGEALKP